MVGRDPVRTEAAVARIAQVVPGADVRPSLADLTRLDDVRALAERITGRVDLLVHNAGTLQPEHRLSEDGVETTAQVSLVAPFLLTALLAGRLRTAPDPRVITVSSGGMYTRRLDVAALDAGPQGYHGVRTYALCKRAQVSLTRLWAERLGSAIDAGTGITALAMHPGWVDTPGLAAALPGFRRALGPLLRRPPEGADTVVWLAATTLPPGSAGTFWHDRRRRGTVRWPGTGDRPGEADRLWNWCAERAGAPSSSGSRP
jgi:NAD(P)-dependent dehydrogenase (short-subunit alcohol dehydrogenase family)